MSAAAGQMPGCAFLATTWSARPALKARKGHTNGADVASNRISRGRHGPTNGDRGAAGALRAGRAAAGRISAADGPADGDDRPGGVPGAARSTAAGAGATPLGAAGTFRRTGVR